MSLQDFWTGTEPRLLKLFAPYLNDYYAEVEEVGTGANAGKVRVRREPESQATSDLPWATVIGAMPTVGQIVFTVQSKAGGRHVITSGGGGGSVSDASTTVKGITKLSTAPVSATDPIAVGDNDTRMSNARTPTAHKTTHEPGGADALTALTDASIAAANKDGAAGTASMRTLGTTSTSAAAGNRGLPTGGTTGQVLKKNSATNYDASWLNESGGSSQAIGAFSATVSASQLNIADQTFTKINYPVEEFDVSGWYDTTDSRYTPLQEGYYMFAASAGIDPSVSGQRWLVTLYKNGVRAKDFVQAHTSSTTRIAASGTVGRIYANGTTDYFEVFCWHSFGVGTSDLLSVAASMFFTGGYEGSV